MFSTLIAIVIVGIVVVAVQWAANRLRTRYPASLMDLSALPALKQQYRWWAYLMMPACFFCFVLLMVTLAAGLRAVFQCLARGGAAPDAEIIVILPTAGILAFIWASPLLSVVYRGLLQRRQEAWEQYKALSWQASFGTLPRRMALRWVRKVRRAVTALLAVYYVLGVQMAAAALKSARP